MKRLNEIIEGTLRRLYVDNYFIDYQYLNGFNYVVVFNKINNYTLVDFIHSLYGKLLLNDFLNKTDKDKLIEHYNYLIDNNLINNEDYSSMEKYLKENTNIYNLSLKNKFLLKKESFADIIENILEPKIRFLVINTKYNTIYRHAINMFINVVFDLDQEEDDYLSIQVRDCSEYNERITEIFKKDDWKDLKDDSYNRENNDVAYMFIDEMKDWFKKYPEWMIEKFYLKYLDVKDWTFEQWHSFYFDFYNVYLKTPKDELPEEFINEYGITINNDILEAGDQWIPEKRGRKEKRSIIKMIDCDTNEVIEKFSCRADVIEVMGIKKNYLSMCLKSVKDFPKSQSKWKRWIHKDENKKYWFVEEEI